MLVAAGALASLPRSAWQFVAEWAAPQPAVGGAFTLTDTGGRRLTEADFAGRPFAIFFGFTHCAEVCPATLERVSRWIAALGRDAEAMRFLFVTVDPVRDTSPVLQSYLANFAPRIEGLTGSPAEIARIGEAFHAQIRRVDLAGGDYTLDHSASVILMDRASRLYSVIGYGETDLAAIERLRRLIGR